MPFDVGGGHLTGKTILVTGAAGGIGLEAVRMLAQGGARVIAGVRSARRGAQARTALGFDVELFECDVSSLTSIRTATRTFAETHNTLDVLINNAGVAALGSRRRSPDGHELTWATNVLGPFVLTQQLLPALLTAAQPRVVNVGSTAHRYGKMVWDDLEFERRRFRGTRAYANSKLALVLFTRELAKRQPRITATCVHPGGIATGIWRDVPTLPKALLMRFLPPPWRGAVPIVRAATATDVATGAYFHGMRRRAPSAAAQKETDAARLWDILSAQTCYD